MSHWYERLLSIPKHDLINEYFYEMVKIFHDHFPCRFIQLFKYSSFDSTISGIFSYKKPEVQTLSHIHDSMEINTYVHDALLNNDATFFNDSRFQVSIGNQFVFSEPIKDMLLVPFKINGVVIAFLGGINVEFEVTDETLEELNQFSNSFINMLHLSSFNEAKDFTDKELLVMKYISNGYTTKEISHLLDISESTIKYFIKNVMEKTNSKNRVETVAKLFRMKVLQ